MKKKATLKFPDGSKYVGEVKNGKRHGQGTYTGTNGEIYVGEWKKSKRHGRGTYTHADGTVEVGIYKKDRLVKKISEDTSAKEKIELTSMIDKAKDDKINVKPADVSKVLNLVNNKEKGACNKNMQRMKNKGELRQGDKFGEYCLAVDVSKIDDSGNIKTGDNF